MIKLSKQQSGDRNELHVDFWGDDYEIGQGMIVNFDRSALPDGVEMTNSSPRIRVDESSVFPVRVTFYSSDSLVNDVLTFLLHLIVQYLEAQGKKLEDLEITPCSQLNRSQSRQRND